MRIKTIFLVIITVLLTIVLMQNNQVVKFNVLFGQIYTSNLVMMAIFAILGFMIGFMVARPRKPATFKSAADDDTDLSKKPGRTLTDEDKDYIN